MSRKETLYAQLVKNSTRRWNYLLLHCDLVEKLITETKYDSKIGKYPDKFIIPVFEKLEGDDALIAELHQETSLATTDILMLLNFG